MPKVFVYRPICLYCWPYCALYIALDKQNNVLFPIINVFPFSTRKTTDKFLFIHTSDLAFFQTRFIRLTFSDSPFRLDFSASRIFRFDVSDSPFRLDLAHLPFLDSPFSASPFKDSSFFPTQLFRQVTRLFILNTRLSTLSDLVAYIPEAVERYATECATGIRKSA